MTRIVAVTIVSLFVVVPVFAECTKADRDALIAFDEAWGKATRTGDRATLERVLAEDYAAFGAVMTTKAQAIANAVRNAEQARANQTPFTFREDYHQINCTPTSATIVHRTVSTTGSGADERVTYGRSIHVVEKRGGRWQAVSNTNHQLGDPATLSYLELEWNDAERNKDIAWFERNLAAEFSGVHSGNPATVLNKSQMIADVRTGRQQLDSLEISELAVRVAGDTAIVTGVNYVKGRDAQGQAIDNRIRFTDTFVKRNGRWQALASQGTLIPRKSGT